MKQTVPLLLVLAAVALAGGNQADDKSKLRPNGEPDPPSQILVPDDAPQESVAVIPEGPPPRAEFLAPKDKDAILAARAMGADVGVGENGRANEVFLGGVVPPELGLAPNCDKLLECISRMPDVTKLSCICPIGYTDRGLAHLGRLRKLKSAEICSNEITDDGLKALAGMEKLESLTLCGSKIRGPGLKYLKGLRNLQELDFRGLINEPADWTDPDQSRNLRGLAVDLTSLPALTTLR
jgi:hypothetical protein